MAKHLSSEPATAETPSIHTAQKTKGGAFVEVAQAQKIMTNYLNAALWKGAKEREVLP